MVFRLTKAEIADRKYKKKVLDLAKQYKKAGDIEKVQRYHVPDAVKVRLLLILKISSMVDYA
jgi:hypothetical protein